MWSGLCLCASIILCPSHSDGFSVPGSHLLCSFLSTCPAILPLHCPPPPSPHCYWLIYPSVRCLLICYALVSESESCSTVSDSLGPHGLYSPWNSPGQNTGVDSLSLLQRIFSTQGSNPGLLHCRWILYQLGHKGSPKHLRNDLRVSRKDLIGP